jgi:hypothetical protein
LYDFSKEVAVETIISSKKKSNNEVFPLQIDISFDDNYTIEAY